MYSVRYQTKRGGSGVMTTTNFLEIENKVKKLFKQKLLATISKDGVEIGQVWKDNTQINCWNYVIERDES